MGAIRPVGYAAGVRIPQIDWWLDVRRVDQSFHGRAAISFDGSPDPLVLDSLRLKFRSAKLDGRSVDLQTDDERGTITVSGVDPGSHVLEVEYDGAAESGSLVGFYTAPAGTQSVLTVMSFPTGSRRLLPLLEHPAIKTVFRLTLRVDPEVHAVFNTPARSQRLVEGRKELVFDPTPPMSAYLLYLGVGPFDTLTRTGGKWSITVDASPGRAAAGAYAADRAGEMLAAYEEYYGIPYPLPKLDLVALENFWAGAMENWGAITFRDSLLLVDPTTSLNARRQVLHTLSHEIAHQWFGNLVTNAWWDDFWLNESFATFVGYSLLARRYPEEGAMKDLMVRWVSSALDQDALDATHPVHVPVESPSELGEHADAVTYGKGAAVLRMMESYLGEESFRRGVSLYLSRHQFGNARATDLWAALGEVAHAPVERVMTEWINRSGFPIVRAGWRDGELHLRQERFRADGAPRPETWPIPLRFVDADGEHRVLFETLSTSIRVGPASAVRIDPGRNAFVRVLYDASLFPQLMADLPSLDPLDQWGVVSDLGAFVYAQLVPFDRILDLLRAGRAFTDDLPIRELLSLSGELRLALHDRPPFRQGLQEYVAAQFDRVGLEPRAGEPASDALVRELLIGWRARLDDSFARRLAPRYAEFDSLPPWLRGGVGVAFARAGGPGAREALAARLRTTPLAGERDQMFGALSSFDGPAALRQSLELIPSPGVTPSGAFTLLVYLSRNPGASAVLFDWYREHAGVLAEMWAGTPLHSEFLRVGLPGMGVDRAEEVGAYFATHTPTDAAQGARHGLETLRLVARLRSATQPD